MKTLNSTDAAATSSAGGRSDKKLTDVKVNPFINFLLGLTVVLLIAFLIMELQTPVREGNYPLFSKKEATLEVNMDRFVIEKPVPKTQVKKKVIETPKEPVKKINTDKAPVIVDNEDPEPEVDNAPQYTDDPIIDKTTSDTPVTKAEPSEPSNFNMLSVSEVPLFPGCSASLDSKERISCLNEKMARYIQRKFDTGLARDINGKDVVNITVVFTIGTDGYPKDVQVRAPSPALEKEARKLISGLPKMKPGKYNGAEVNTTYALPIRFKVQ
jgi:protein TonB